MNTSNQQQVINILIKNNGIDNLRKKYDPNYDKKFKNHLTLVYTFSGLDQRLLSAHIKTSIQNIRPFNVVFNRFWKFKDNPYIYILSDNGTPKFMKLYKKLNSDILRGFKNKSMPKYIPHLSLATFKTNKAADKVFSQIKNRKLNFRARINSVQLLTLNKNHSIKKIKNFRLK